MSTTIDLQIGTIRLLRERRSLPFLAQASLPACAMQVQTQSSWAMPGFSNESLPEQPALASWDPQSPSTPEPFSPHINMMSQPYTIGVLTCLPFILTYLFTTIEAKVAARSKKIGRKAPLVPYAVPIIGHAGMFVWSLARLIQQNRLVPTTIVDGHDANDGFSDRFDKYVPVRFRGMMTELCFVSGPKNVTTIFKYSRSFSAKASVVIAMDRLFGTPRHIVPFYDADDSGIETQPHPQSNVKPEDRVHHTVHVQVIKYLSGPGLKPMTNRLMDNIGRQVSTSGISYEWLDMPDLFEFCQVKLLYASLDAMFGPYLTALNPDFVKDYWAFDKCTSYLLKGFPRFVVPGSWKARERCLNALKKYNAYANKLHDGDGRKTYEGLDPFFGTEFIRQRKEAFSKMGPMNADAIASEDLAIMWA